MAAADHREDLVDGRVGRQRAVEDVELALEALGNVVAATSGLDHCRQELKRHTTTGVQVHCCVEVRLTQFNSTDLHVDDGGEVARFLEVVEASHLHQLPHDLVGDLVSPVVDDRHVDVVYEDAHSLARWRPVRGAHPFVHVALYCPLLVKKVRYSYLVRRTRRRTLSQRTLIEKPFGQRKASSMTVESQDLSRAPTRTEAHTWNMSGVVADEKLKALDWCFSGLYLAM